MAVFDLGVKGEEKVGLGISGVEVLGLGVEGADEGVGRHRDGEAEFDAGAILEAGLPTAFLKNCLILAPRVVGLELGFRVRVVSELPLLLLARLRFLRKMKGLELPLFLLLWLPLLLR